MTRQERFSSHFQRESRGWDQLILPLRSATSVIESKPTNGPRLGNPWGINIALPGIDVETVGLHENGHSLQLGHFGPPPNAVRNPVYAGIRQSPLAIDNSGMCGVWASWPR